MYRYEIMMLSFVNPIRAYVKKLVNEDIDTMHHSKASVIFCQGTQQCPFLYYRHSRSKYLCEGTC